MATSRGAPQPRGSSGDLDASAEVGGLGVCLVVAISSGLIVGLAGVERSGNVGHQPQFGQKLRNNDFGDLECRSAYGCLVDQVEGADLS